MQKAPQGRLLFWPAAPGRPLEPSMFCRRLAEGLEQRTVDRILLRIVFGMPLHTEREASRICNSDRLDGAVLGDTLDDHTPARFENALPVQRIHADGLASQNPGECSARGKSHFVAIGKDHP